MQVTGWVGTTLVWVAFGCSGGGDQHGAADARPAGESDAGTTPYATLSCPGVTAEGDGAGATGPIAQPSLLDHSGCASSAPLDTIDPCGIWHLDLSISGAGRYSVAVRVDPGEEGGLHGLVFGRDAADVRLSPTDLFIRRVEESPSGLLATAIDFCAVRADGGVEGLYAVCGEGGYCDQGTFLGYKVEPLEEPRSDGLRLVSEWNGPPTAPWPTERGLGQTYNVRHHGDLAYLARAHDGLRIVDLSDPAAPADVGHSPPLYPEVGEFYNDVKLTEADGALYALMASSARGVVIIDLTDPARPVEVATVPETSPQYPYVGVHTIFTEAERVYATNLSHGGVDIFHILDPTRPTLLGRYVQPDAWEVGGYAHDLYASNGRVYISYWSRGMVVIDSAEDPANPTLEGIFDDYEPRTSHSPWVTEVAGRSIAVVGDEGFGAHVRVVDATPLSDTRWEEIGSYATRPEVSVHNIMTVGETALVTYYQDGLRLLDLTDPTAPAEVAHYQTWPGPAAGYGVAFYEGAIGVDHDPERDLILVADTHRGLLVLEREQ